MPETMGVLESIMREGACKMLQAALEAEIEEHLERYKGVVDKAGNRLVVRNGSQPERRILTGAGPISLVVAGKKFVNGEQVDEVTA